MENSKNTTFIVLALVVVVVAGILIYNNKNKTQVPAKPGVTAKNATMPPFILGNFEKLAGQTLSMKVGADEKTVTLSATTKVVKQVTDKSGKITLVEIKPNEIKANAQIVVYYSGSTGSEYIANKIQVISQ